MSPRHWHTHRLYIRGEGDAARRSCQTVLAALLRGLLAAMAPLAPHMAEDAWLATPQVCGELEPTHLHAHTHRFAPCSSDYCICGASVVCGA